MFDFFETVEFAVTNKFTARCGCKIEFSHHCQNDLKIHTIERCDKACLLKAMELSEYLQMTYNRSKKMMHIEDFKDLVDNRKLCVDTVGYMKKIKGKVK